MKHPVECAACIVAAITDDDGNLRKDINLMDEIADWVSVIQKNAQESTGDE